MSILDWGPFSRVRRNHALEHATLQVLAEENPRLRMAGYSGPKSFWLVGEVDTDKVVDAARQALARMQGGERGLAIHPHCGTNLVTTGMEWASEMVIKAKLNGLKMTEVQTTLHKDGRNRPPHPGWR